MKLSKARAVLIVLSLMPMLSNAKSKITLSPQVGVQLKQLDFSQNFKGGESQLSDNSGNLSVSLPSLRFSLGSSLGKNYSVQFKYETSLDSVTTDSSVPLTQNETGVERTDMSINFSYRLPRRFRLIAGYVNGETKLTPIANDCYTTNIDGCLQNLSYILGERGINYVQNYEQSGLYLGSGYTKILDKNIFSFVLAYAYLDSIYEDNNSSTGDFKFTGNSDGFTLAAALQRPLNQSFYMHGNLRYQNFASDGSAVSGTWSGSHHTTTEKLLVTEIGLSYRFTDSKKRQ